MDSGNDNGSNNDNDDKSNKKDIKNNAVGLDTANRHDYKKKNKVSVWVSQHPYEDIPDGYFEESFAKKGSRARNDWSDNFKLRYFKPDMMETNGSTEGTVNMLKAAGECSYSTSYMETLSSKAREKGFEQVTWVIMLFELEYNSVLSGVESDEFVSFLGVFDYDDDADNLYEIETDED